MPSWHYKKNYGVILSAFCVNPCLLLEGNIPRGIPTTEWIMNIEDGTGLVKTWSRFKIVNDGGWCLGQPAFTKRQHLMKYRISRSSIHVCGDAIITLRGKCSWVCSDA